MTAKGKQKLNDESTITSIIIEDCKQKENVAETYVHGGRTFVVCDSSEMCDWRVWDLTTARINALSLKTLYGDPIAIFKEKMQGAMTKAKRKYMELSLVELEKAVEIMTFTEENRGKLNEYDKYILTSLVNSSFDNDPRLHCHFAEDLFSQSRLDVSKKNEAILHMRRMQATLYFTESRLVHLTEHFGIHRDYNPISDSGTITAVRLSDRQSTQYQDVRTAKNAINPQTPEWRKLMGLT